MSNGKWKIQHLLGIFMISQTIFATLYWGWLPLRSFQFTTIDGERATSPLPMNSEPKIDYDMFFTGKYLRSYDHWIRGLWTTKLENTPGSNCLYPSVPFEMLPIQTWNADLKYNAISACNAALFSEVFERTALVKCNSFVTYFESDTFIYGEHIKPMDNDTRLKVLNRLSPEYNIDKNEDSVYVLRLRNTTQLVWIRCGRLWNYHFTLLPLRQLNQSLHTQKKQTISKYFGDQTPPNVLIFVMDSTSRSNFIRGAPESVDYLSNMLRREKDTTFKILQWFRYSTIAWGTGKNLGNLLKSHVNPKIGGLSRHFDELGYYVPGWRELVRDSTNKVSWSDVECHYLSYNVFQKDCHSSDPGKLDIELAVEFALQLEHQNRDIPWFTVLHTQTNHRANAPMAGIMDRYVRNLIERMDKRHTIIHLQADHGTYQTSNIYGNWESQNPVGIQMIPNYLFDKTGVLNLTRLRLNEQRLVHHRDMYRFYRELLCKLSNQILEGNSPLNYNDTVMRYVSDDLSISIIDKEVAIDRPCTGIKMCFCEVFEVQKDVPDPDTIELILDTINGLTGNGQLACNRLNSNDFSIISNIEASKHSIKIIEIEQTQRSLKANVSDEEYKALKEEFKILRYSAVIKQNNITTEIRHLDDIPLILRKDYFKYEKCLTTQYDLNMYSQWHPYFEQQLQAGDSPEPVFVNPNMTIQMLQQQREQWNLRLCHCKGNFL
eukprot:195061_1